jgi:Rrf2 family protein
MLSKKTRYALKALVVLGKNFGGTAIQISKIATEEHIPIIFVEHILLDLRNAGLLFSKKGSGGGYGLVKDPADIYVVQILRLTGGPVALLPCVSLNFYQKCDECVNEATCGVRDVFVEVRDATVKILSETSIADLIQREKNLISSFA